MKVTVVANYDDWFDRGKPAGALWYYQDKHGNTAGCHISCPCGCGGLWGATFPRWRWNGDVESPTINPSLRFLDVPDEADENPPTHWHGFIREGIFDTCQDSPNRPNTNATSPT